MKKRFRSGDIPVSLRRAKTAPCISHFPSKLLKRKMETCKAGRPTIYTKQRCGRAADAVPLIWLTKCPVRELPRNFRFSYFVVKTGGTTIRGRRSPKRSLTNIKTSPMRKLNIPKRNYYKWDEYSTQAKLYVHCFALIGSLQAPSVLLVCRENMEIYCATGRALSQY